MTLRESRKNTLKKLFTRNKVVAMKDLKQALNTNYSMTVFRYLREMNYLSSYNHAGGFYTLPDIPNFDEYGLWHYKVTSFSKHGTLKSTVWMMIESAPQGFTHRELKCLLRCRVQNTLNDLVENSAISREIVGKLFLYVSANKKVAVVQISQRQEKLTDMHQVKSSVDLSATIEILLELLHSDNWNERNISTNLQARGIPVTAAQVKEVFIRYSLKKKS